MLSLIKNIEGVIRNNRKGLQQDVYSITQDNV